MKYINDFIITENKRLNNNFSVLTLQLNSNLPKIIPGQFAEVRIDSAQGVLLRRPISIHDVDYTTNSIKLLIQNVGKGSNSLCDLPVDRYLNLIYPLGNGFQIPEKGKRVLLIGGGCGIAPLLYLGKILKENDLVPRYLIGARSAENLILIDEYRRVGEVLITTDDGTYGCKGNVMNHTIMNTAKPDFDIIYSCGPEIMMKELSKYSEKHGITCFVSLENRMACGIGACLCCIIPTIEGNECTCIKGPIFNSNYLKW